MTGVEVAGCLVPLVAEWRRAARGDGERGRASNADGRRRGLAIDRRLKADGWTDGRGGRDVAAGVRDAQPIVLRRSDRRRGEAGVVRADGMRGVVERALEPRVGESAV